MIGMTSKKVSKRDQPKSASDTFVSPKSPAPVQATTATKALRIETQARIVGAAAPPKRSS